MRAIQFKSGCAWALMVGMLAAGTAWAEKPAWAGGGKHGKHDRVYETEPRQSGDWGGHREFRERDEAPRGGFNFDTRQRSYINDYYAGEFGSGRCPPGLAKKHNGCMPPGQARKWAMGRPLPRDVVTYNLPSVLVTGIGLPPPGYRYVRVANDILMIAIGTGMVVDAIMNLGGMR